ncbi:MAG: oxidoreductase, partial [Firmicutes bacterium]|nr:oxidoreductase [Bacillota bacterium]
MAQNWTLHDMPELVGKRIIVTGGNSGIGLEAARLLATKGAHITLAVRSPQRGADAAAVIRRDTPDASVDVAQLDLASLDSVRNFASEFLASNDELAVLINNAGVMAVPLRKTADGHELQFGTNHLGHFALTGLLLPRLLSTPGARVVTVSSAAHRGGRIDFDNLDGSRSYSKWGAYSQSKLANLLFATELSRRLQAAGADVISVACHPGWAATNLTSGASRLTDQPLRQGLSRLGNRVALQDARMGALPTVYAA